MVTETGTDVPVHGCTISVRTLNRLATSALTFLV